ncbi:phosphate/phosphite/phosphonate ABC transporter substrate-binding protein [Ilumatobacter coccineus]|uniref:Phosphonate ABC transporter phosphonate-binding protein n=1 Tax=Ilumatobacter coccineus (strain NBRC 103263 / KCTC 29153 / YM16-304) TaxID=1313172 RepID=A0A6C7ECS6_ILUCY|nr:phosphate/phosphite/phosphonate ABC transporter substrate-binding protein [Ilumatobacter coccineus]BAN03802.1 phosphonate ABC transporter phosphonate-binding protein [Ilumatobacter coccineus YM16-304]
MKRSITKRSFLAVAASASLVLAACGSDDEPAEESVTTEAEAPAEETEEEAPAEEEAMEEEAMEEEAPAEEEAMEEEAMEEEAMNEGWPEKIVFTLTPSQETGGLIETAQPLADLLAAELGVEVEALVPSDYAGVIVALQSGQAQVAGGLGPSQMVQAADTAGANLILQAVRFGDSQYVTQWFTNNPDEFCDDTPVADEDGMLFCNGVDQATGPTDGPIGADKLSLIAGKTVSFVDQGSTSGYLIPSLGLLEAGVDPLDDIESLFAGGHDSSVQAVYDGDAEVGVSFNDARGGVAETVPDVGEKVVVFGWSSPIPNDGFAVAGDLPEDLQTAIADAFTAIAATEDGAALLDELYEIDGLVPVPDGSYDIIRNLETELADLLS